MREVLIIQAVVKHYRKPFFEKLAEALDHDGIRLTVAYSDPSGSDLAKADNVDLTPRVGKKIPGRWLLKGTILLQRPGKLVGQSQLVVAEQANKHLLNLYLLLLSIAGRKRVALWGHGRNLQGDARSISERIKRRMLSWPDWWFAYTPAVRDYLISSGVPKERITTVLNSVDLTAWRASLAAAATEDEIRRELGIDRNAVVGLYCGALYSEKCLPFLIEAAQIVAASLPSFVLLVVGDGPERPYVQAASRRHGWIRYLGAQFGPKKAKCYRIASAVLNPGLVGLGILDAFGAGVPLVTTDVPTHSPEIEYLESGINGLMTPHDVSVYARRVVELLSSESTIAGMRQAALRSSQDYSIEEMVFRFRTGILACLASPSRRGKSTNA